MHLVNRIGNRDLSENAESVSLDPRPN